MKELLSRRDVIKTFMVTTATSLIGNKVWAQKAVGEVAFDHDPDIGHARVVLSSFPALSQNNGSVRLGSSSISSNNFPVGLYYPLIINRISASEYVALNSECAHAGCVVNAFAAGAIHCNCHGSEYNIRGQVTQGPAQSNLQSYPTRLENGILLIEFSGPALGFSIRGLTATGTAGQRLALTVTTFQGVEYEVRYRATLNAAPTVVPNAPSLTGPITQSFFTGNDLDRTVYVTPQNGFFQIAIRLRAV